MITLVLDGNAIASTTDRTSGCRIVRFGIAGTVLLWLSLCKSEDCTECVESRTRTLATIVGRRQSLIATFDCRLPRQRQRFGRFAVRVFAVFLFLRFVFLQVVQTHHGRAGRLVWWSWLQSWWLVGCWFSRNGNKTTLVIIRGDYFIAIWIFTEIRLWVGRLLR